MRFESIEAGADAVTLAAELRRLVPTGASVAAPVAAILERVRQGGDAALAALISEHDTRGAPAAALHVRTAELERAEAALAAELRSGLQLAIANVEKVATAAVAPDREVAFGDHTVTVREVPVRRAGIYVPGGRAPYLSTVVMGVVAARAAGVREIIVASPADGTGDVHPAILAACRLAGATEVIRAGGAHAIAALAFGTETVRGVDVIAGPGNLFVQEAKRQVADRVGIDSFAGPSDLLVIAGSGADPELVALDLIAQAEHGAGTLVVAASDDELLLAQTAARLEQTPETEAVCRLIEIPDCEAGLTLAEAFAPEHLELVGTSAEKLAPRVTRAGCVFVGSAAGTAFGDYIAGSNHTLPTGGAARFASALGPRHFRRTFTEVTIASAAELARAAAPLARAEGFEFHARSMEARIGDNPGP